GLALDPVLSEQAQRHSEQMAAAGSLFHTTSPSSAVDPWVAWGENVGLGPDPGQVHNAFMGSPRHAANIDDGRWTSVGVGAAAGPAGMYFTEFFVQRPSGFPLSRLVAGGAATEAIQALSPTWFFADGAGGAGRA